MKKFLWFLLFFLTGCLQAPQSAFQINEDKEIINLKVAQVEMVPMGFYFHELPHIENQMPLSPEDAIREWSRNNLMTLDEKDEKLLIVVQQAEMIKTDQSNLGTFKLDEETYTLSYAVEFQLKKSDEVIKHVPVKGKGFVNLAKKSSLAQKEKGWAWLVQKMINHLKTKLKSELNEIIS